MTTIADIQNSSLWEDVYSVSKTAEYRNSVMFTPIPEIVVPFPIESQLSLVYTESANAPDHWYSSGWLSRYVATGVSFGGVQNTKLGYSKRCLLRKLVLVDWDTYGQIPRFVFKPHKWLDQITFHIWQFKGQLSNEELERIDVARISLARLETAVTFLAQRDQITTYNVEL